MGPAQPMLLTQGAQAHNPTNYSATRFLSGLATRTGIVLVGGVKTHLGGTGMRHSTARGSVPVFRTLSQRGPFKYSEKVSGETVVTQERWGRPHF